MEYGNNSDEGKYFVGNCGVWESWTTVNQYFMVSGIDLTNVLLKTVLIVNGKSLTKS
jgi:hypothetical protein